MKYELMINGSYYCAMNGDGSLTNPPKIIKIPVVGYSRAISALSFIRGDDGKYYVECDSDTEKRIRRCFYAKFVGITGTNL